MPESSKRYDRRLGPRDRDLRAADQDRDAVAGTLHEQHLAGRLDREEYEERVERCLAAKTYADLDKLVTDFPEDEAVTRSSTRRSGRRPWPFILLPLALIAVIAASGGHVFWLAIPLLFFFVVRPLIWGSWGRGFRSSSWGCNPRYTARNDTRA
jgi:hypothetical protein